MSGSSGSHREVVITTRIVVDKGAAQTALRETVKAVAAQQKAADQAASQSAKAQVKAVRDAEREKQKELAATNKRTIAILRQDEKEAIASEKAKQKAIAETNKQAISGLKQREAAAKQVETAGKKAHAEYARAQAKITSANDRVTESFKTSLSGAMSLGRGIAMLGIVGEKDTEKLLRGLVRIQAAFDIMRGSVELVHSMTRGWRAYRDAVAAAAVAQSAMGGANVASAGGAAVGIGGMLKGKLATVGRIAAPIAAGIGGYYAGRWMAGQLGLGTGPGRYADAGSRAAGAERGTAIASREISQRTAMEANRREWYGSTIQSQMFGREENPQARLQANRLEMAELQRRSGQTIGWNEQRAKSLGTAAAVHFEATGKYDEVTQRLGAMRAQHLLAADRERVEMLREMKRLTEERGRDEIEAARKAGQFATSALLTARQQVETAREKARITQEEYLSGAERFGQRSAREQRKAIGLKERLDRGEKLTLEQRQFMRSIGDEETTGRIRNIDVAVGEAAGYSRFFGSARSAADAARVESVAASKWQRTEAESLGYSGLASATEKEIVHRIEVDVTARQDQGSRQAGQDVLRIRDEIFRAAQSIAQREAAQQVARDRLTQASQDTAGRGG